MRLIGPLLVAVLTSIPFVVTISNASESGIWRFWGSMLGAFSVCLAFGTTLWLVNRGTHRGRLIGRSLIAFVLVTVGSWMTWVAFVFGVHPLSLGGLAVYPATLTPVALPRC